MNEDEFTVAKVNNEFQREALDILRRNHPVGSNRLLQDAYRMMEILQLSGQDDSPNIPLFRLAMRTRAELSRRLYTIALQSHGPLHWTDIDRQQQAERRFPDDLPLGSMSYHDTAWHMALLDTLGNAYWRRAPQLLEPNADYQAEADKL